MSKRYTDLFHESMQEKKAIELYTETLQLLKNGHWPTWYVNVIMQNSRATADPADILAFAEVHGLIALTKVWTCELIVHYDPFADNQIEENNHVLKHHLPEIFEGEFIPEKGRSANSDGYIKAKTDFTVTDAWSANEQVKSRSAKTKVFSLEVGYTKSVTTYRHLMESGCVARWPYGSKKIYLLDMFEYNLEMKSNLFQINIEDKTND